MSRIVQAMIAILIAWIALPIGALAAPASAGVQTAWRLLDYVAVDYGGAVSNGRVISEPEFAEMKEFSASIAQKIDTLPPSQARAELVREAQALQSAIAAKAAPASVALNARGLASKLLAAYPVPLAPAKAPNPARGAVLFAEKCASCHGANGGGRGPAAAKLDPPPIAFRDTARARERSLFALYQVIDQGLDGTAMQSFADLPSDDRWALAFYVGQFAFPQAKEGERIWSENASVRTHVPDLAALTTTTPAALGTEIGHSRADAVMAYLRANPRVFGAKTGASLALVRSRLRESLAAYRSGNREAAKELALSAYLDGFEPLEPLLMSRDASLLTHIEAAMGEYRATVGRNTPIEQLESRVDALDLLLTEAQEALSPSAANGVSTFVGAFTILLREGLEALLIVIAMVAFLKRAERPEVLRYVHAGWIVALAAGAVTWAVATYAIGVSGASRELTEGFGSIFAAVVLVSVGIWMHGKAQAQEWQRYIRETLGKALSKGSSWFLFGLAFLVVYREVFETILFYAAMSADGNGGLILAGAAAAALLLGVTGWAMLRYSRTLPIGTFFSYSSALIAVLAVVLAGKGVAALQEAGLLDITPLHAIPRITMLGLFPALEPIGAQLATVAALAIGFWYSGRSKGAPVAAE